VTRSKLDLSYENTRPKRLDLVIDGRHVSSMAVDEHARRVALPVSMPAKTV
jgi:hypothetical protein